MKTIKTLQILINLLYYILVGVLTMITVYYLILLIAPDILPGYLQVQRMLFTAFDWKLFLGPILSYINFGLFIYAIYLLKKVIPSFKEADFYSETVIKNLKKSGKIFIFIGLSMTLFKLIILLFVQSFVAFNGYYSWWGVFFALLGTIDFAMVCLVIIGLFFLLFSDSYKSAGKLKAENDLTI
ncbi:MAG: DUF2975 domain-containing protein [Flavobacteriaceae bacterium]